MATKTLITGTDFICIPCTDIERSVAFYGGTLGLPQLKRWGNRAGVEFETGNLTVALMQSDDFGLEFRSHSLPVEFQVDDVPAAEAELESRGVQFLTEIIDSGFCHQVMFSDPDGNTLALHHRYSEGRPAAG
jgi:catechol 2,3-dioxygenase-like lactoylglutathione lyase family enzyme